MNKKALTLAVLILIIIVCGMFVFGYLMRQQVMAPVTDSTLSGEGTPEAPFSIDRVELKHFYTESVGVHTLVGEFLLPTTCDSIVDTVALLEDSTRALVSFGLMHTEGTDCIKNTAPTPFKVGFLAKKDIKIEAVFEGKEIITTIVEAKEGERP